MENELSIFMARLISLIYIPVGIAIFTGQLKTNDLMSSYRKSAGLTMLLALFGLTFGMVLIQYHNIWVRNWPVLITLLGWIAVIECLALIAFPKAVLSIGSTITKKGDLWGFASLLVGVMFGYFGFFL